MLDPKNLKRGGFQGEYFRQRGRRGKRFFQADYRARDGKLFSCITTSEEEALRQIAQQMIKRGYSVITDPNFPMYPNFPEGGKNADQ